MYDCVTVIIRGDRNKDSGIETRIYEIAGYIFSNVSELFDWSRHSLINSTNLAL